MPINQRDEVELVNCHKFSKAKLYSELNPLIQDPNAITNEREYRTQATFVFKGIFHVTFFSLKSMIRPM